MPSFSPDEQFGLLKEKVIDAYKSSLDLKTKNHEIKINNVFIEDTKDHQDLEGQKKAIVSGRTWSVPIKADLTLYEQGKKKERKVVTVGHLPKMTDRLGYIIGGNEYQSANLLRLRPGVYHRQAQNDDLLAEFNLGNRSQFVKGKSLKVKFDPESAEFHLLSANRKLPLLPLLYDAGLTDKDIEKYWGKEILESNKKMRGASLKAGRKKLVSLAMGDKTDESGIGLFKELLDKTELDKETTGKTLGKGFTKITPEVFLRSGKRLIEMSKGNDDGDDKGSLNFLSIHSAEDLISNRIKSNAYKIKNKMKYQLERRNKDLKGAIPVRMFDNAINGFFNTSLARQGDQTNPLEMLSGHRKTTLMGEQGGIQSSFAVLEESKLVNPSHLGFLDPIETPEGDKTGVSLALSIGADKKGNKLGARFINPNTGKVSVLTPAQSEKSVIGLPDNYDKKGKRLVARGKQVQAIKNGELMMVDPKEVDYVLPSPRGMFSAASNLIPFLQNNQGNRAMTAVRQQAQASPLKFREAPLVQVLGDKDKTFEEIFGQFSSTKAPIDGKVVKVGKNEIHIKAGRKTTKVPIYRDFPLKGHSLYDSEVKVKKGDTVKKGQLLADTTFTKDGKLALGTNLKTAYMPFKGYNFEDGIVISQTAAKKLTSQHIYPKNTSLKGDVITKKSTFLNEHPYSFVTNQVKNIGDDGVIKVGSTVNPGDPLILKMKKPELSQYMARRKKFGGRALKYRDKSLVWNKGHKGVVTDIVKKRDGEVVVYVKTDEPAQQGDKLVGRHGNKGIITRVIPDNEMPYKDGKEGKERVDILLNPLGVPGRINLGQVLETVAGKMAEKDGKAYKVRNFEAGKDYLTDLKMQAKKKGIKDKEDLINPDTGKPYKQKILTGNQYILKLKHQVQKKMSARSGGPGYAYNINHAPTGGSDSAKGNTLGELGLFAMLAHGARKNLHEMFTYKSDQTDGLWDALREGTPLPPPKVPFAFEKFLGYMNGMRVNVRKEGNSLQLVPFTEKQLTGKGGLSNGQITKPGELIRGKNLKEINGGLFDPNITGGINGTKWSHVKLEEEIPNPLFEDAIVKILDLKKDDFNKIVSGKMKKNGKTGGDAIRSMLEGLNIKKERKKLEKEVRSKKKTGKDKALKKLKIIRALDEENLDATVYMMKSIPILPPHFRPITVKDNGDLSTNDLNGLYKDVGAINDLMKAQKDAGMPSSMMNSSREEMYQGVKAIMGLGGSLTRQGDYKGIVDIISGKTRDHKGKGKGGSSKGGYFHSALLKRRQDFTARSTIIPEPRMGLDEVGLPEGIAWKLYEPFIQRKMIESGLSIDEAEENYKAKTPMAEKAMEMAVKDRPVLVKRDPSLHKFNIMAFKPRLIKGKAIEIHPLTVSGYNADFDGDTMAVYLPITSGAVKEAYGMFPSNNLFSETTGGVQYVPGHEALLGMYLASKPGKKTNKKFQSHAAARSAFKRGKLEYTDIIKVGGKDTTLGRLDIEAVLPNELKETGRKSVKDMRVYDKKQIRNTLATVAKKHPKYFGTVANTFKDIGNKYSTELGFSIGLDDFNTVNANIRDKMISDANKKAASIRRKNISANQKYRQIVTEFSKVDEKLDALNSKTLHNNQTNIYKMLISGARGKPEQLKQIVSSPILVKDGKDRVVPYLIPRSYSEGMDIGSYWTTLHGARKGTIQKTQGVRDPGYISKQIQHSVMNTVVSEKDCGTQNGIMMDVNDIDITDRRLAGPANLKGMRFKRNDVLTSKHLAAAKGAKKDKLFVRSALRCEAAHGVCQMCAGESVNGSGPLDIGTNIGVISGHAIGEPSVQLSMNVFHTGGLAKGRASKSQSTFKILSNLMRMPQTFPDAAVLSPAAGKIEKIEKAPQGGNFITIGKSKTYVPATRELDVKLNTKVQKGQPLSDGVVNPVDFLSKTNITKTQDQLTHDIHSLFKTVAPIRRRNVEVVVKAMTNITKVEDPAAHPRYLPGDIVPTSQVRAYNKTHKGKEIKHKPIMKGINVLPHLIHEDWMARLGHDNISRTLVEASREGWKSNIHGFHPIPAIAYAKDFGIKSKIGIKDWKGEY